MHLRVRSGSEHYALPVEGVREIAPLGRISPLPGAPAALLGVWNLRGDVMAVVDLASLLGIEPGSRRRIVVVEREEQRAGLAVADVLDVASLPDLREPADSPYLSGAVLIEGAPVGILDVGAVLDGAAAGAGR